MTIKYRPQVGVSSCLIGEKVRYNKQAKSHDWVMNELSMLVDFIPMCPEVYAGMGTPRPTIGIYKGAEELELRENISGLKLSDSVVGAMTEAAKSLPKLDAFIFKSKSPSCGIGTSPIHINGKGTDELADGFFYLALKKLNPKLVMLEDIDLNSEEGRASFKKALGLS